MRVEALVSAAGPPGKFSFRTGDIMNLPDSEAEILLAAKAVRRLEPSMPAGKRKASDPKKVVEAKDNVVAGKAPEEDGTPTVKPAE